MLPVKNDFASSGWLVLGNGRSGTLCVSVSEVYVSLLGNGKSGTLCVSVSEVHVGQTAL